MNKLKLSKQTIFTLLGILVIVGSIPLAVILVKQRQEIRKEAAITDDSACAKIGGTCRYLSQGCGENNDGFFKPGYCSGPTNRQCCLPPSKKPTPTPTPKPVSGQTCGSWCASKVGHADFPWCICNADRSPASGYTEAARTTTSDCTKSCVAYTSSSSGDYQQAWGHPVWGRWNTGRTCSAPPPTPTPTGTVTPTPTGTATPTPTGTLTPTPTPTPTGETPTPTTVAQATPTPTLPPGVTPTPTTALAQATPTPVVELPTAGFVWPTFGAIIGGLLLIAVSLVFIL